MNFIIPHDHPALPGHFPGQPVVPGVVVLDHVLSAIEREHGPLEHGPLGPLRLPQVKFVQPLLPGQPASVVLEVLPTTAETAQRWRFKVLRDDAIIATGEVCA